MGSSWRIAITKEQYGQLGYVNDFINTNKSLVLSEIKIPLDVDIKNVLAHAGSLAGPNIRSLELHWTKKTKDLRIMLVADAQDIVSYQTMFKLMYPSCDFFKPDGKMVPDWYDTIDQTWNLFDVETTNGHFFSVMDYQKNPILWTKLATIIQEAEYGMIQFCFKTYPFVKSFSKLSKRMEMMERKVNKPIRKERVVGDKKELYNVDHREKNGDFNRNAKTLFFHLGQKQASVNVLMSVRGLIKSQKTLDLGTPFDLDTLPFQGISNRFEYLSVYEYHASHFLQTSAKVNNQKVEKVTKLDLLFRYRLLPNPNDSIFKAVDNYVDEKLFFGSYHIRKQLPFLTLSTSELSLLLALPDANIVPNVKQIRGSTLPSMMTNKEGFSLGVFSRN